MGCRKLSYYEGEGTKKSSTLFFEVCLVKKGQPLKKCDSYYPFGLTFNSFTRSYSEPQRFKYNGKEEQEETGWIDFGARMHMPDIARFTTIDPQVEKYSFQSPYVYAANNPVRFIEINGEEPAQRPPNIIPILKSYNSHSKRLNFAITNKQFYPPTKERASRLLQKAKQQKNMQDVNKVAGADGGPAVLGLVSAAVNIPLGIRKGQILQEARQIDQINSWSNDQDTQVADRINGALKTLANVNTANSDGVFGESLSDDQVGDLTNFMTITQYAGEGAVASYSSVFNGQGDMSTVDYITKLTGLASSLNTAVAEDNGGPVNTNTTDGPPIIINKPDKKRYYE